MQIYAPVIGAAAILALTACANGVTVSQTGISHGYSRSELSVVGTGGNELRVEVTGNPYGIPKQAFDETVVAGMQGKSPGAPVTFALEPQQEDTARHHRVVIVFDPATILSPSQLCTASQPIATKAPGETMTVMGAYCQSNYEFTHAAARAKMPPGANTPEFRNLVTQLTLAMFPITNPHTKPESDLPCTIGMC